MTEAPIQIGPATLVDTHWLLSVDTHVPPSWVSRCIGSDQYLITRSGAEPAGFLRHSMFWGVIPFMDLIFLAPAWRRRGLGSSLFQAWQQAMRAQGATVLMTSSMMDELEPQAWHERNGFERSGTLTFGRYQSTPEVFFVKSL